MPKYRRDRINDAVTREMAQIMREVKDPRLSGTIITVTGADVTADMKYAKVYYSVLGEFDEKELQAGLKSASGFTRHMLAERLNLRITPEISFRRDEGVRHGADIAELLKKLSNSDSAGSVDD